MVKVIPHHRVPFKAFALTCGFYGIVQSIIMLCIYYTFLKKIKFWDSLTSVFISSESKIADNVTLFMTIQTYLSIALLTASVILILFVVRHPDAYPNAHCISLLYVLWGLTALAASIVDVVFTLFLIKYILEQNSNIEFDTQVAMILIGFRYVVFWFLNTIFGAVMLSAPCVPVIGCVRKRQRYNRYTRCKCKRV